MRSVTDLERLTTEGPVAPPGRRLADGTPRPRGCSSALGRRRTIDGEARRGGGPVRSGSVPAGCSGTPLVRKLGIKSGDRVRLAHAPPDWRIDGLSPDVTVGRRATFAHADVVVAFFRDAATMEGEVVRLARSIVTDGSLWIAWPRRAGGHESDITDRTVRASVLPLGLVDVKVAALDDDWSALKAVWRLEHRQKRI